jgi:hypothetical protein
MRLEKQERHSSEWKSSAESAIAITVQRPQKKKKNKTIDTLSKPPEFLFSFDEDIKSRRAKSAFPPRF